MRVEAEITNCLHCEKPLKGAWRVHPDCIRPRLRAMNANTPAIVITVDTAKVAYSRAYNSGYYAGLKKGLERHAETIE